ncbi:MAG: Gfo/Idh/MocA family oxidoreductase [Planctomycetaceae bacterium]|jgi:predicted dehydrogenase|nr:Gfo/Idh/MocA family oxidoreductase [Planctomycetaceae bacterium]
MQTRKQQNTRRDFLKKSGTIAVGTALTGGFASGLIPRVHAAEDNTIKVVLVGCGGRGTGAASQALSVKGPTKLVGVADFFEQRAKNCVKLIKESHGEKVDVPPERIFSGLHGYKHAVDLLGSSDVALFATPPAFRPIHVEYAVNKGVNVFMEKSFAVDAPGINRIRKAGELAKQKNLKIAGGLMSRHSYALNGAIEQIHSGAIGDAVTCWAYREHGAVGFGPKRDGESDLAHQIRNYSNFTWLNGSFLLDWLIHNIDVCCWVKGAYPVSAQGMGGRQVRTAKDQLFDHYGVEYRFPDGTTLFAQGRHQDKCWGFFGSVIQGSKGSAVLGEGISRPKLYKTWKRLPEDQIWEHKGEFNNFYQTEHDLLFDAIRNDKPYNETEYSANSAMTGILGLMAVESGREITWEQASKSEVQLAPNLDTLTEDSPAPVLPDENGNYPIALPGVKSVWG